MFIAAALRRVFALTTRNLYIASPVLARANLIGMCLRAVAAGQGNG